MGLDLMDRVGDLMPHSPGGTGGGMAIGGAITSATAGSVLFAGVGGVLAEDNTKLFWDDTNDRLGIGTNTPAVALSIFPDADTGVVIAGRGRLDARVTDTLCISHFDQTGTTGYNFQCSAAGGARVNALAGQIVRLCIGDSTIWQVTAAGHIIANTDNTNDIGADGATRPRNIRAAGKVAVGAGNASAPTLCFDAEESTGAYNPNVGEFAIGCSGSVRMRITTTGLGVNGQNPTAPQAYSITNVTTDRACDADTVAVAELADIVGTLIADLRAVGLVT